MMNKPRMLLCKTHDVCSVEKRKGPNFGRQVFVIECFFDKLHQTKSCHAHRVDHKKKGLLR